jgi:Cu+-exporting ATPase
MDRRKFLYGVTAAGTAAAAKEPASVNWDVKGFTCITCAVGLEVMLKGLKGVVRVKATYPDNKVSIGYDGSQVTEKTLREFIVKCGFRVA